MDKIFFLQKTNVLAGAINSSCNPVFYCIFMPGFRRALLKTFVPCFKNFTRSTSERSSESNSGTTSLAFVSQSTSDSLQSIHGSNFNT